MKKKLSLIIGILAFALLIAGASMLYHRMTEGQDRESPAITTNSEDTDANDASVSDSSDNDNKESAEQEDSGTKQAAPDFTVLDQEENAVRLSDFTGKPVIVNFWASWCPPCKSEMPDFETAFRLYGEDIQFMMINLTDGSRETIQTASDYISEQEYTFPVFYDTESEASTAYYTMSIPATYFIDAEGYVAAYATGALDAANLQKGIELLIPEP